MHRDNEYYFLPDQLVHIFHHDKATFVHLGVKQEDILLVGDMDKKPLNRGLVHDISRKTLKVQGETVEIKSELFAAISQECKEGLENILGKEPTEYLFSRNFYVQEIIKWNYNLITELCSRSTEEPLILKRHNVKDDSYNLTVDKDGKIYITCTQSGFDDPSDIPIVGPHESKFELTDHGFKLVYLKSNDKRLQDLLEKFDRLLEKEEKIDIWIIVIDDLEKNLRIHPEKKSENLFSTNKHPFIKYLSEIKNLLNKNKPIAQLNQAQLIDLSEKISHISKEIRFMLDNNQVKLAGMANTEIYEKIIWPMTKDLNELLGLKDSVDENPIIESKRLGPTK